MVGAFPDLRCLRRGHPGRGDKHGHRVLRGCGQSSKVVRAATAGSRMDRAIADRTHGSILLTGAGRECTGIGLPTVLLRRRKADEISPAASIRWRGGFG